jgi:hypothetical protein
MYIVLSTLLFLCLPFCLIAISTFIEIIGHNKIRISKLFKRTEILMIVFAMSLLSLEGALAFKANYNNGQKDRYYKNWKETIEKDIEINGLSNNTIKEIYQYNYEIKIQRYYYDNKWTSYFADLTIAKQSLIDTSCFAAAKQ